MTAGRPPIKLLRAAASGVGAASLVPLIPVLGPPVPVGPELVGIFDGAHLELQETSA